jgi:hypothetical protein
VARPASIAARLGQFRFSWHQVESTLYLLSTCKDTPTAGRLKELIEATKAVQSSQEQREEQRRSFAYGNTAFENSRITREMVAEQAELLAEEKKNGG